MEDILKILRYNTGTDKKAFIQFKHSFDAVIFNATIVAYSGASVADLVSMHKRKYIIDPQTHIFQQDISAITVENKKTHEKDIKKSVIKYLQELPESLSTVLTKERRQVSSHEIKDSIDSLVNSVYKFQTEYVKSYISDKDYDKYLKYADLQPEPRLIIAPYFMLKDSYNKPEIEEWLTINKECLMKTIIQNKTQDGQAPIAAQIVLDKAVLVSDNFLNMIRTTYALSDYEYIFLWVDDFNVFETRKEYMQSYADLIATLNDIGKKPIMAYGGYESIILCSSDSPHRLYGAAQSVGYGEYRPITPVGGGLPVNKYYFYPLHQRMRFDDAAKILSVQGYFNEDKNSYEHATDYYRNICDCKQCHEIILKDIHNFDRYNDSTPYSMRTRNGMVSRNRPTADAELIAAFHFLYCKVNEWKQSAEKPFNILIKELKENYEIYLPQRLNQILEWCKIYGCEED